MKCNRERRQWISMCRYVDLVHLLFNSTGFYQVSRFGDLLHQSSVSPLPESQTEMLRLPPCRLALLVFQILSIVKDASFANLSLIEGYGQSNPASLELQLFAENNPVPGNYTRADGVPIDDYQNSLTAGRYGPLLMQDINFLDDIQHIDRERIPERVVHAKGAGAFGYFLSTNDLSQYTQASVLNQVGQKTPVVVRFSRVLGSIGEADTVRDVRGFAIKFYTDQGNWDLVGLNLPVFWVRDPLRFPNLIHSNRRNPATNLYDPIMFWDFASSTPETLTMLLNFYSDKGIPMSYRLMNGHGVNTFTLTKPGGPITFVKFHLTSNQGVINMPPEQAVIMAGRDADWHTRDLYDNIAKGNFPSWNVTAELLTPEQAKNMRWNPFDVTKIWDPSLTTTVPVGMLVLNKNPSNFFAQMEQVGYDPGRLIPGIEPSVDRILQGRLFSYSDALMYRLGVNNELLPVNRPLVTVENGERDGRGRSDDNQGGAPNYFPNSFNGPQVHSQYRRAPFPVQGIAQTYNSTTEDNFTVPSLIWSNLTDTDRNTISTNIANVLTRVPRFIQERALNNFYQVSPDWGSRVAALLNLNDYVPQPNGQQSS